MNASVLTQSTQPVKKIKIKGKVINGVLTAAYHVTFKNEHKIPIETSFTLPLPSGFKSTKFSVKFNGEEVESGLTASEESKLEYDDAVASSNLAVMAQTDENNNIHVDIGSLIPGETAKIKIFFDLLLTPIIDGYSLIIPTSVKELTENLRAGTNPIPISLKLDVSDHYPIISIRTPNNKSDIMNNTVTTQSISMFRPFQLVIRIQKPEQGYLVYNEHDNNLYSRLVCTSPKAIRDHPTQFSILVDDQMTSGQLSVLFRALEFFTLSIPYQSRINIAVSGMSAKMAFDKPMEMTEVSRRSLLSFLKQNERGSEVSITTQHNELLKKVIPDEMESVVVVVSNSLPSDFEFKEKHFYVLMDPFGTGEMREVAEKNTKMYVPVADDDALVGSILQIIRMTSTHPIPNVRLIINDEVVVETDENPASIVSLMNRNAGNEVTKATADFNGHVYDLEVIKMDEPSLMRIMTTSNDDNETNIAVIEREEAVEDMGHIESKISKIGVAWVNKKPYKKKRLDPTPPTDVHPIPRPFPRPFPMPRPILYRNPHTIHRYIPTPQLPDAHALHDNVSAPPMSNRPRFTSSSRNRTPSVYNGDLFENQEKVTLFTPERSEAQTEGRDLPVQPAVDENRPVPEKKLVNITLKRREDEAIKIEENQKPKKHMFFLLRCLQLQAVEGCWKWSERSEIQKVCGFPISDPPEDIDFDCFMTVFVIACISMRGKNEKDKWDLCVEKAQQFIIERFPEINWEDLLRQVTESLQTHSNAN